MIQKTRLSSNCFFKTSTAVSSTNALQKVNLNSIWYLFVLVNTVPTEYEYDTYST